MATHAMTRPMKKQSLKVHLMLAMVCPIIGNMLYAKYCNSHFASKYTA
jgi:hypothetical protein